MTTWRASFWWLAVPTLVLAWVVWRLPEPARDGSSRIVAGATDIRGERDAGAAPDEHAASRTGRRAAPGQDDPELVQRVVAGLRSFAIIFSTGHYGISKPTATFLILVIGVGALAGVYVGGRSADRLLRRGYLRARVILPAACLLVLPLVLAPAIATESVGIALPLLVLGAFLLGAPNPALDAARLDIMPSGLWGRAEAVRTVLRSAGEAAAPLLFGYVSQYVFGGPGSAGGGNDAGGASAANSAGLEYTFLLFLGTLLAAGLLALAGLRTYPRDVATAAASANAIGQAAGAETEPTAGLTFRLSRRRLG